MESKKKILLLITKSNWGGAQRYVYDLATNLDKNLFEVAVALGGNGPLKDSLETSGIRTITLERSARDINILNDLQLLLSMIRLFKTERPDVVHLNSSKVGLLGALAARLAGISKIIFTAHAWAFNEDRNDLVKLVIKFLHWITIVLNHEVIAVSESVADQMKGWPFVERKILVSRNGIKTDLRSRKEASELLFGDKLPPKRLVLGTIAELHPVKGQKYLIEALAGVHDLDFICAIIGEGEERTNLERSIKEKNLDNKVYLFGHIDRAASYLKAFDIFLLPSISEGLGYAVLEAGAAGLPVIASRVGGIPEIVENLRSGLLVTPRRPNEIKNALIYLHEHPEEMKLFGKNLREKVEKDFSLDRMVNETEKLYLNS